MNENDFVGMRLSLTGYCLFLGGWCVEGSCVVCPGVPGGGVLGWVLVVWELGGVWFWDSIS